MNLFLEFIERNELHNLNAIINEGVKSLHNRGIILEEDMIEALAKWNVAYTNCISR